MEAPLLQGHHKLHILNYLWLNMLPFWDSLSLNPSPPAKIYVVQFLQHIPGNEGSFLLGAQNGGFSGRGLEFMSKIIFLLLAAPYASYALCMLTPTHWSVPKNMSLSMNSL